MIREVNAYAYQARVKYEKEDECRELIDPIRLQIDCSNIIDQAKQIVKDNNLDNGVYALRVYIYIYIERERERERDRQRQRDTERHRHTHTHTHTERERERERERE